jgi:MYXO-CTERM domain-containing protein
MPAGRGPLPRARGGPGQARVGAALAAVAVGLAFVPPKAAFAHAPPFATGLSFQEVDGIERVLVHSNRGFLVSTDGGESFALLCNEAYGASDTDAPAIAETTDGNLLIATTAEGLLKSTIDLCEFAPTGGPAAGLRAGDVTTSPSAPETHYVIIAEATSSHALFSSPDDGASWTPLVPMSEVASTRIRVAPGDPERLYRSGVGFTPEIGRYHHISTSADGGATWVDHDLTLVEDELLAYLLAVAPDDSLTVYVRALARGTGLPGRLLVSRDAGATFAAPLVGPELLALAFDEAQGTVWVGGAEGLWASNDGGVSFHPIASEHTRVSMLEVHEGALYVGAVWEAELGVSVSFDQGATFEHYLRFRDVRAALDCPPGTRGQTDCVVPFREWQFEVLGGLLPEGDAGLAPPGEGEPTPSPLFPSPDASPQNSATSSEGNEGGPDAGCTCSLPARGSTKGGPFALVVAAALALWRRR